jgi:hypothetical protein
MNDTNLEDEESSSFDQDRNRNNMSEYLRLSSVSNALNDENQPKRKISKLA